MCAYTFLSVTINMIAPFGGGGPTRTPATPPTGAASCRPPPAFPPPHALPARAARSRACTDTDSPHTSGESSGFFWGPEPSACPTQSWHDSESGSSVCRLRLGASRRPIADARGVSNKPIVERRRCILEWSWRIHTHTAKCARVADNDESAVPHYTAPATPRAGGSAPPAACGVRSRPRQTPSTRAQVLGTCDSYPLDAACLARFR